MTRSSAHAGPVARSRDRDRDAVDLKVYARRLAREKAGLATKMVALSFDADVLDDLTLYARERGISKSEAIREAWRQVREDIRRLEPEPPRLKAKPPKDPTSQLRARSECAPKPPAPTQGKKRWKYYNKEKRAQVYWDAGMHDAIRAYAAAENITVSMAVRRAWRLAKAEIKALPKPPLWWEVPAQSSGTKAQPARPSTPRKVARAAASGLPPSTNPTRRKVNLYLPASMVDEVKASLGPDSIHQVMASAWLLARDHIRAIPSPPVRIRGQKRATVDIRITDEIRHEATRTGLGIGTIMQYAWNMARDAIRAMPPG